MKWIYNNLNITFQAQQQLERDEVVRKTREEAEKQAKLREDEEKRKAAEETEKLRREEAEREEKERLARKQRVEAIMARTRLRKVIQFTKIHKKTVKWREAKLGEETPDGKATR